MCDTFQSHGAGVLLDEIRPDCRLVLSEVNQLRFPRARSLTDKMDLAVKFARDRSALDETALNELFVVQTYVRLFFAYCSLWKEIVEGSFSESWSTLQDALDAIRLIKRFSTLDISFFEDQLLELEKAYPYRLFCSIGATVGLIECSICGQDIDSDACPHRRGDLYMGEMACGIARENVDLDHIALVTNPNDKRCVVQYENSAPQFKLVRFIADLVQNRQMDIVEFKCLEWSKLSEANPGYVKLGRNENCSCGSGKKFKRCCIDRLRIERDHVDVIPERRRIEAVIV